MRYPSRHFILALGLSGLVGGAFTLADCTTSQTTTALSSPAGQLFCAIATPAGSIVAGLITAGTSGAAAPLAVLATDATTAAVNADCAKANGVPVSPPASPSTAPQVAIVAPASPVAAGGS